MPDTGRPPDVSSLTRGQLERTRRDLAAALALARPGSPARAPIGTHLAAIDAELASRTSQVRGSLEDFRRLRMALDLLEERLLPAYTCDGLESGLLALREKIDAAELTPHQPGRQPGNRDRSSVLVVTTVEPDERSPTTELRTELSAVLVAITTTTADKVAREPARGEGRGLGSASRRWRPGKPAVRLP